MQGISPYLATRSFPLLQQNGDASVPPGANARAVFRIPVGPSYISSYLLLLKAAGAAATRAEMDVQIVLAKIYVDGDTAWEMTGLQATAMAEFYHPGSTANGILPFFFADFLLEDPTNIDGSAWGTAGLDTLALEITYSAAPTILTHALYHNIVAGEELGAHLRWQRFSYNYAAIGTLEIDNIPRDPKDSIYAIHISPPTGTTAVLTNFEIICDTAREVYATPNIIHARYKEGLYGRTVQALWPLHLDFSWRGRHADRMPLLMGDLRLKLTWGTAAPNQFDVLVQRYRVQPSKTVAA
jgi:hypothetical protein